jgi:Ca2+-binding EF-hand superfamily protein
MIACRNALAYMENKGRGMQWDNVDDISAENARWCAPKRHGDEPTLGEWLGGADETRPRVDPAAQAAAAEAAARLRIGMVVRVLWEETARSAVENCDAITTGWTAARAARCGHEGIVGRVDPDGTCRVHFEQPAKDAQAAAENTSTNRELMRSAESRQGAAVLACLHDYIVRQKVRVHDIFEKIDYDGSGELDEVEFAQAVTAMGFEMPCDEHGNINGLAHLQVFRMPPTPDQITAAFRVLDYDGGGQVDAAEFLLALKEQKALRTGRVKQALAAAVEDEAPVHVLADAIAEAEAVGVTPDDPSLTAARARHEVASRFLQGDAGYGSGVAMAVREALAADARRKLREEAAAAAEERVASGESAREEVLWFPIEALEPLPDQREEHPVQKVGTADFALVDAGAIAISRVIGYEVSGCTRVELNGSYDAASYSGNTEDFPAFRHVDGHAWLYRPCREPRLRCVD